MGIANTLTLAINESLNLPDFDPCFIHDLVSMSERDRILAIRTLLFRPVSQTRNP